LPVLTSFPFRRTNDANGFFDVSPLLYRDFTASPSLFSQNVVFFGNFRSIRVRPSPRVVPRSSRRPAAINLIDINKGKIAEATFSAPCANGKIEYP